jgi:hypothetical protein
MTLLKWLAAIAFVLAILFRLARPFISFGLAFRIAPDVHQGVSIDSVLFWGLLALSAILALIICLRHAH